MTEIVAPLQTIAPLLEKTTLRQLSQAVFGWKTIYFGKPDSPIQIKHHTSIE